MTNTNIEEVPGCDFLNLELSNKIPDAKTIWSF